jgi:3-oxocholest-4-en-26-oyl-CoA dehydrogenase beta subunit
MDFDFTDTCEELAGLTRRIVTDLVSDDDLRRVEQGEDRFDPRLWDALADAGVLGAALPERVGGGGGGVIEQCRVLAELGRGVAPVPMVGAIAMGAGAVARFGTDEQQQRWARPAAEGSLLLTAALVEEGQPALDAPTTHAEHSDDGWLLTGAKTTVPGAMVADAVLVPAATGEGVGVFVVPTDSPGLTREPQVVVDGDREAALTLQQVPVGHDALLGSPEDGAAVVRWTLDHGVLATCALQLGTVARALEMTAEYAKQRVQFGRPVGSFQAVSQRLADGYIDVEGIRLTLWQAAWRLSEGLDCEAELATAKFWAAEGGHRVAHTAVHVHGGVGIDMDYPLHRYFVAAKRNEFTLGAATEQLRRLGRLLADEPV